MAQKDISNSAQAFDAFAKKLRRFNEATDAPEPVFKSKNANTQINIKESDEKHKKEIIDTYKKFLSPYETYGKKSAIADEIERDKKNLLVAYNLYKALQGVNEQFANDETFLEATEIVSPLVNRERYTFGGEFIYLQCWLKFENGISDYMPVIWAEENAQDSYAPKKHKLRFINPRNLRLSFREREISEIVAECFYPGAAVVSSI